jgi:hypothetical protein
MDRLKDFMSGFAAASELLHRAFSNGFLVEAVVLGAAVIDGSLRIGLILQHQIETKSEEVLEDLLYQGADDRGFPERQVYRRARETGFIDDGLYRELHDLYDQRNRVVHRYIISEFPTRPARNQLVTADGLEGADYRSPSTSLRYSATAITIPIDRLVRRVEWKLIEMPLFRLQVVGNTEDRFIYEIGWHRSVRASDLKSSSFDNQIRLIGRSGNYLIQPEGLGID